MISDSGFDSGSSPELHAEDPPMSRTHQYRKVMKPLLERKRRARINKCLDDLKDLMVSALKSEGESITKLEKADVLELTVKYLKKLKRQNALGLTPQATYAAKFRVGYVHCAQDVSRFMTTLQSSGSGGSVDVHVSTRLLAHLANCCQALETMPPSVLSLSPQPHHVAAAPAPTYPHVPSSAFSPVLTQCPDYERFDTRLIGKENQAMDLSSKPALVKPVPTKPELSHPLHPREDPSWRPW